MLTVPLFGIGLFGLLSAVRDGQWNLGMIVPGLFLASGVWLVSARISGRGQDSRMYCRKQTVYVLTNQRAFVLKGCRTRAPIRSVAWRHVDDVVADALAPYGRGTVQFRHWNPMAGQWETLLQFHKAGNAAGVAGLGKAAMVQASRRP